MDSFKIKGDFIKLNQLLKLMGWCSSGAEANAAIEQGLVMVNGNVETRKRNKIMPSFQVTYGANTVLIE
ncbi:MAG: RNA-binding S4 domain-containing protein [Chitinophagaceae bacterium]|nr:RNA-binding S4 domain-containing protein [Chitinophagaceae bacterium]